MKVITPLGVDELQDEWCYLLEYMAFKQDGGELFLKAFRKL